jgi:hypothetical protein
MSDIGKLIDEVIELGLKQLMKENGFKKKRRLVTQGIGERNINLSRNNNG